jgi:hypothetical protein
MHKTYHLSEENPGRKKAGHRAGRQSGRRGRHTTSQLKVDEHTLASSLDPDEISRLEFEPEHIAIIFKRPKNYSEEDQFEFKVSSLGLFWFKDRLVLILPVPFGNMGPGIAVCVLALALLERDGKASLTGLVTSAVALVLAWGVIVAIVKTVSLIVRHWLGI